MSSTTCPDPTSIRARAGFGDDCGSFPSPGVPIARVEAVRAAVLAGGYATVPGPADMPEGPGGLGQL